VIICNCVTVAVYCVIALLLIGNCHEDRILFNAIMHGTVNTGHYQISNLRWKFSNFQHSEWIRWLQGIVKRCVMKVCTGLVWLMIRCGSGFYKRGKQASSCACCPVTQLASITQRSTEPMPCLDRDQCILWHFQPTLNCALKCSWFSFVFLFTQNFWDKFSKKRVCQLFLYVILLRNIDTNISANMLLPPEECFLHKHLCENMKPLICIFSYKKLFIWIQEHLPKTLIVLITSILFCSFWQTNWISAVYEHF